MLTINAPWIRRIGVWAGICFGLGCLAYIIYPGLLPEFLRFLEKVFKDIFGPKVERLDFSASLLIFRNNLVAASFSLFLGVFLGIIPVVSVGLNFFVLGFLFAVFITSAKLGGLTFFFFVMPHGIFEIPALIIAAAFGLKLGFFWTRPTKSLDRRGNLLAILKQNLQILPLLILLFLAAALTEVFVTGNLVRFFVK